MARLSLSDAILHLRSELAKAQEAAKPNDLRFEMREIELELQIVANEATEVEGNAEASGSIWSVVTAKIGGSASRATGENHTHRVKLTMSLAPTSDGKPIKIGGKGNEPR